MITDSVTSPIQAKGIGPRSTPSRQHPTIWGLTPLQLHDHFWAARGVAVARLGEETILPVDAELYLLTDARTFCIFRLAPVLDTLSWVEPDVMFLRLVNRQEHDYREKVVTDSAGRFVQFHRTYGGAALRLSRVALTRDRRMAYAWQRSADAASAWKKLRRECRTARVEATTISGRAFDRSRDDDIAAFVNVLIRFWKQPSATVVDARRLTTDVWASTSARIGPEVCFVGPAWIGAGRQVGVGETVLGPAVLWDDPGARPQAQNIRWSELEPAAVLAAVRRRSSRRRPGGFCKRFFDIAFAAVILLFTLPLYPFVMLAIWLEDGRPFFFAHQRETLGGREFGCIKFRSMRKDAERVKAALAAANLADGPQFYIRNDPRLTRVGSFIRRTNIDELPQFINVLLGDMSVVGPRPSPRSENQFSPAWREARLSVRSGITGLWQVSRTRRPGEDFQEWIKYDLEYVNQMSLWLDLVIIWRTIKLLTWG